MKEAARDQMESPGQPAEIGHRSGGCPVEVALLGAEVIHEVAQTLNYLRYVAAGLADAQTGMPAPGELAEFTRKEITRLEQLIGHLRPFKLPPPELKDVPILELIEMCVARFGSKSSGLPIAVTGDVTTRVRVDPGYLEEGIEQLLLHAQSESGIIAIRIRGQSEQNAVVVELAAQAAPLEGAAASSPFEIWRMLPVGGPGYRRALASRLLRQTGISLVYERIDEKNIFRLTLSAAPKVPS